MIFPFIDSFDAMLDASEGDKWFRRFKELTRISHHAFDNGARDHRRC
jgi:hypothetical protein